MEKRDLALSLLVLVVFVSGCVDGGDTGTEQESTGSITIHSLDVHPQEIYEGDSVQVSLDLANTGNLPAEINAGDDGKNILKDHCRDIFSIPNDGFQSKPDSLANSGSDMLHPSEEAALSWTLQQDGDVPELYDQKCNLKFQIPFSYSVSAYKQIQIKSDRSIEGTQDLQSESSSGPLLFAIETVGGTGSEGRDTFIADDGGDGDETVRILLQLQNTEQTDYNKGVVDINESSWDVSINGPGSTDPNCEFDPSEDKLMMYEGQSRVISCEVPVQDIGESPSVLWEIRASIEYRYLKDAGSRTVTVKYDGS